MKENVNINQVEKMTGVSKRNIRFYEKEGLLLPKRNSENGYRVYDENDIWRIKVIKMLRMLDMPLEEIQKILEEECSFSEAIVNQKAELERKALELQAAIQFCEQLKETELNTLDVDGCLGNIESTGGEGFFKDWIHDYKLVVEANRNMDFTFIPDTPITNEREFTDALFAYANDEKVNLVIIKESMYPEFTIDGVEYTAERYYRPMRGIPVAVVSCHRKNREIEGEGVDETRKDIQWFLHRWGWLVGLLIFNALMLLPILTIEGLWYEKMAVFVGIIVVEICMYYMDNLFHYNDKTRK